jgi:hypothetical protein
MGPRCDDAAERWIACSPSSGTRSPTRGGRPSKNEGGSAALRAGRGRAPDPGTFGEEPVEVTAKMAVGRGAAAGEQAVLLGDRRVSRSIGWRRKLPSPWWRYRVAAKLPGRPNGLPGRGANSPPSRRTSWPPAQLPRRPDGLGDRRRNFSAVMPVLPAVDETSPPSCRTSRRQRDFPAVPRILRGAGETSPSSRRTSWPSTNFPAVLPVPPAVGESSPPSCRSCLPSARLPRRLPVLPSVGETSSPSRGSCWPSAKTPRRPASFLRRPVDFSVIRASSRQELPGGGRARK